MAADPQTGGSRSPREAGKRSALALAEPQVVNTLRSKRDEIERTVLAYEERLASARRDLATINAALQIFEVGGEVRDFPLPMSVSRLFRRGEIFGYCRAALGVAPEGLDTRELAVAVCRAKGLDEADKVLRNSLALTIVNTLGMRAKRGQVVKAGKRKGVVVWRA